LLVTTFVKMSTRTVIVIPGMRASLSTCAPQMVHLQTAWNSTVCLFLIFFLVWSTTRENLSLYAIKDILW